MPPQLKKFILDKYNYVFLIFNKWPYNRLGNYLQVEGRNGNDLEKRTLSTHRPPINTFFEKTGFIPLSSLHKN